MNKLSTILRLLVLIVLTGWLGIAVQPASAQQTVTLSGRVTDTAGNAVSGAVVDLFRLPGRIWIAGQQTDGNGSYRHSVPPGTYALKVWPSHGPLIAQNIEGLTLSTDTTRNIVLEAGVTLSGQVTGPNGQPVPGAWLWIVDSNNVEVSFGAANASGRYSLGVPVGTYRVNVGSEDFLDTQLEGVAVTQATVLNITLESGVLLEGKVVDDVGQPVPDARVCAHLSTEEWWEGFCTDSESEGGFQLRVVPAEYVVTVRPVFPLRQTRHRLEVSGEGMTNLMLTVSRDPMPLVPDDPPKAALISMSSPTAAGEVTLRGAAGSVPPHSTVVAITLNTGHFTTTQATASGSFTATLFAPAGTSILMKADPVGTIVARFLDEVSADSEFPVTALAALPNTILRVVDLPGAGIPISGAGKIDWERFPAWTFHGSIPAHTYTPGDSLRVQGTVRVESPALQGVGALQGNTRLRLRPLSDPEGASLLQTKSLASILLTPTGLPIEREPMWWVTDLFHSQDHALLKTASTQAEAKLDLTLPLPPDLPAGYYSPILEFNSPDMPTEHSSSPQVFSRPSQEPRIVNLPIIRVGNPALPRLDWVLLLDTPSNGSRGVLAMEDADRFGVAQRILTPSETFVIPRLSAASGQPLSYRLEPFVPTLSLSLLTSELGSPNSPRIPFDFPSGSLTVTIHHPDGTETVLGPAPFVQSRSKGLGDGDGTLLSQGGGHLSDAYQLSTMDPRFEVAFAQDGLHVITVEGTIDDIWGNTWTGGGTYEVHVGRILALDTAVLPGTHFEVGDGFNPGLVVSPPLTAEVEVWVQHVPHSDISQLEERIIRGRTNRFGYFQPAGNTVVFDQPGEYRVDITARGEDAQGQLWMGSRTWGGVVAPVDPLIVAHGRRGIDNQDTIGPQWFTRDQTGLPPVGDSHLFFPFQSGDVSWLEEGDSGHPHCDLPRPESPAHHAAAAKTRQVGGPS